MSNESMVLSVMSYTEKLTCMEIGDRVRQRYDVSPFFTPYVTLHKLEKRGLVNSNWKEITPDEQAYIEEFRGGARRRVYWRTGGTPIKNTPEPDQGEDWGMQPAFA